MTGPLLALWVALGAFLVTAVVARPTLTGCRSRPTARESASTVSWAAIASSSAAPRRPRSRRQSPG